jgi:lipid-A-disaccharide synthase
MKYYIIAGEASGDLHGSRLIHAIKKNDPNAQFRAWGGDLMQAEGAVLVKHYRELAFMGFIEVLKNILTVLSNLSFCKSDIKSFQPDAVIFIDYPGFNLPIAKFAKAQGYKTVYYISPQVWAWKEKRVNLIKKAIDLMLVILPFEKSFYEKWNYKVEYVGHPLIEIIENFKNDPAHISFSNHFKSNQSKKIVAILPGSRKQEIEKKLPIMLDATKKFHDIEFIIAQAPGIDDSYINDYIKGFENISIWKDRTYQLLSIADAAMATSGTATLETALFGVPEIVCYKTSSISYALGKYFIKVPYISLVNLIMNKAIVKELIQDELDSASITRELGKILNDTHVNIQMKKSFEELRNILLPGGNASVNAAKLIQQLLNN